MAITPRELEKSFHSTFENRLQPAIYRAPGRVNLIGEHTDYNQGLVCPIAIEMACYIAIAPANHGLLRLYSEEMGEMREIPIGDLASAEQRRDWSDYPIGVAQMLVRDGHAVDRAIYTSTATFRVDQGLVRRQRWK